MVSGLDAGTLTVVTAKAEMLIRKPVAEVGFTGDAEAAAAQAIASTEGFTLVVAGLKALLEHGIRLNLVADRFPRGLDGGSR